MHFTGTTDEFLELRELAAAEAALLGTAFPNGLRIIWNTAEVLDLRVDGQPLSLRRNQLIFLTEHHRVEPVRVETCRFVRFNRPFFCVIDRDSGWPAWREKNDGVIAPDERLPWPQTVAMGRSTSLRCSAPRCWRRC